MKDLFGKKDILFGIIFLVFVMIYIITLGAYPLMDVDETRYVLMAKDMFHSHDFMTLWLNGEYFFEKPPLFFWLENFSFWLFGDINEFTARFPMVLLSILPMGLLFTLSEKIKNRKFAFLNCTILLTTLEYILITKMAILDSVLTSFVTSSVLCYFFTFFVREENKKYFWWMTYIFSALAVLAKGIPGAAIPALIILAGTIIFKTYKETLKNMPVGILLFLVLALPWHIVMLHKYGTLFFNEYIIKHHLLRFLGSEVINKNQPVWFYAATLIWGLFPWIFSLLFNIRKPQKLNLQNTYDKFLALNIIAISVIFLFFTSSGAKLVTYILPIYPFFAGLIGHIWYKYIFEKENCSRTKNSIIFFNSILLLVLAAAPFARFLLPVDFYLFLKPVQTSGIIILTFYLAASFVAIKKDLRFKQFLAILGLIALLFGITAPMGYKLDYSFGQNDLMKFAKIAQDMNYSIATYKTGKKYSLNYYANLNKIDYQVADNLSWFNTELKNPTELMIMRNKDIKSLPERVTVMEQGIKYSIIK